MTEPVIDDLSVVIVSFNTVDLLRTCLQSVRRGLERGRGRLRGRVIVVDNASTDHSPAMVQAEFPEFQLIALEENRGFAAASNLGIREAPARYVLLLNPDTEILGDSLAALVQFMDAYPRVGACGARLLNPDLTFQHSCFRFPTLPMSFLDFFPLNHRVTSSWLNGRYPRRWYDRSFAIDHPLGACLMVRREVIDQVGLLDEGFFMYCEEVDWCYRIKQAGWEIFYTPDAQVIHHGGASTRQTVGRMFVELHRSRDRFFRKHYGPVYAWLATMILRLGVADLRRRALAAWRQRQIDDTELARRLEIYRPVVEPSWRE